MLLLEAVSLHVASVQALSRPSYRERGREAVLLGLHAAAYLTAVVLVLSPLRALVFVVVQQGLFGLYLGCASAPNHKGMPILTEDDDTDFLRRQVLTSRNVRGGWLIDSLLGGLNYQIEHHLFPSMPRASLRHARPIVRAHCLEHGLPYIETSLFDSYRQALHHLHTVGRTSQLVQESEPAAGPAARLIAADGRHAANRNGEPRCPGPRRQPSTRDGSPRTGIPVAHGTLGCRPHPDQAHAGVRPDQLRKQGGERHGNGSDLHGPALRAPRRRHRARNAPRTGQARHTPPRRRIRVLLLVLALLLPLLITTLLGGH